MNFSNYILIDAVLSEEILECHLDVGLMNKAHIDIHQEASIGVVETFFPVILP